MSYSLFLARKLSFGSNGRGSSPAVKVAIAAVALSVTVMIIAVAIVLGFKREIREKVRGFNSDITLFTEPLEPEDSNLVDVTPGLQKLLLGTPGVSSAELNISSPVIFKTPSDFKGVYMKSAKSPQIRKFLKNTLIRGYLPDFEKEENSEKIVISRKIADQLGLDIKSRIDTYFITDDVRVRRFEIAGIYDSHFESYDDLMVYGSERLLQTINNLTERQGTSVLIEVDDFNKLEETAAEVRHSLFNAIASGVTDRSYKIQTAYEAGAGYFNWLGMLDTNVIVILTLMMAVGCVTLVSGMLIIILDKRRFIGTLKALGTPTAKLRQVFVFLAIRIALTGMIIGDAVSLAFLFVQYRFHLIPLDPESYYMNFVPVSINVVSIIAINLAVLLISYLVLILPSRFVSRISPAETMRDEAS